MEIKTLKYLTLIFAIITVVSGIFAFSFLSMTSGAFDPNDMNWVLGMIFIIIFGIGFVGVFGCIKWWGHKKRWGEY